MPGTAPELDRGAFRHVLSHFPTGVVVVTAIDGTGEPAGMAIGSFTSVSLDPPLVVFLPARTSTTFPRIRSSGSFCVNVLGSDQEHFSHTFSVSGGDTFDGVPWRPAGSGSPIIDGVVAWIDCEIEDVAETGDHYVVLGRVQDFDVLSGRSPLVFFQSTYRRPSNP
jgi:3-hydroxy-9,10-secoandrosta-1,3,5(10)-triene-9,17-dione monooxygenase reductase component